MTNKLMKHEKKRLNCNLLIEKYLFFLVVDYNFVFSIDSFNYDKRYFDNQYGRLEIYDDPYYESRNIKIIINNIRKVIDPCSPYSNEINFETTKSNKGFFKSLFIDDTEEYYKKLSIAIKNEISKTGTIFGLKIN